MQDAQRSAPYPGSGRLAFLEIDPALESQRVDSALLPLGPPPLAQPTFGPLA